MLHAKRAKEAFTLIELLVVIAILAILFIVVLLVLNPAELLAQSRDADRIQDLATLSSALGYYVEDAASNGAVTSLGNASTSYVSVPDPSATSTLGDACQGLSLLPLPFSYSYHCASPSSYRNVNGMGWIPVNFSSISVGSPISQLPQDPTNATSSRLYYAYATNGSQYELTAAMESAKYQLGGSNDVISNDGGVLATVYEKGTKLGLEPLDYGDPTLVGWWSFNEGTGSIAYDYSGNNATGSWSGVQIGTNGTYYSTNAKVGTYSGDFDGTTNSVVASDHAIPSGASSFTKMVWLYLPNGITSTLATDNIIGWGTINSNSETNVLRTGGVNQLINYMWSNDLSWYSSHIVNGWNSIVVTYDGSTEKGYVNGVFESSYVPTTPNVTLTSVTIGGKMNDGDNNFSGLIDDVRVYSRALTAAQITAMYNGGK